MIDGINVISETIIYEANMSLIGLIVLISAILSIVVFGIILKIGLIETLMATVFISFGVCAIFGGVNSSLNQVLITENVQYIDYICTIDDEVHFNDVVNNYEIIEVYENNNNVKLRKYPVK